MEDGLHIICLSIYKDQSNSLLIPNPDKGRKVAPKENFCHTLDMKEVSPVRCSCGKALITMMVVVIVMMVMDSF